MAGDIVSTSIERWSSLNKAVPIWYEDIVGENGEDDLRITTMDPNTRTLIRVQLGDIENDMNVFQMLRGDSKQNLLDRKQFLRSVIIRKDDIDT